MDYSQARDHILSALRDNNLFPRALPLKWQKDLKTYLNTWIKVHITPGELQQLEQEFLYNSQRPLRITHAAGAGK